MLSRSLWISLGLIAALITAVAAPVLPAGPALPEVPAGHVTVLTHKQPLRFFAHWRWVARGTAADAKETPGSNNQRWVLNNYAAPTPLPDPAWTSADFDDISWNRRLGPVFGWLGYMRTGTTLHDLGLLCTRAHFSVEDPAKATGVKLYLAYRGGAVVYLNGTEVARGHLPAGKIEPLTLAEDYTAEQFALAAPRDDAPVKGQEAAYLTRVRELTVDLPARLLRKGDNVLACELHRTALPAEAPTPWATAGLVALQVTAPEDAGVAVAAPTEPYVWNADPLIRAGVDDQGQAPQPLRAISIVGPRNGIVNGQVAVSLPKSGPGCVATISNLSFGAHRIPSSAVRVRYAQPGVNVPALSDTPAADGTVHPIWITVAIPKDVWPGTYRGTLTVATPGAPTVVPVELTVTALTMPDRADWKTDVHFLQSPEAVAGYYKVPLWSDEHFAHLDRSLAMLAYAGTSALSIGALAEDIFGADPSILFVKEGDAWVPDLRYAERYLATYAKHGPAPRFVSIQCWNYSVSGTGNRRDSSGGRKWLSDTLKVHTLQDGKLVKVEMPGYTKPGSEETWRKTIAGVRGILTKLGWTRTEVLLGTSGDDWPVPEIVAQFKAIDPTLRWRVATHGSSVSKWGPTDAERTQGNGMIVGWANLVRRIASTRREVAGNAAFTVIKRDSVSDAPSDYFTLAPLAWAAGYSGCTNRPFDYWTYTRADGKSISPLGTYVSFGNITPHGPRAFVTPGPDGPMPTPQLELVREGVQLNEAVMFIEGLLASDKTNARIGLSLGDEARQAISDLHNAMEASRRFYPAGGTDVRRRVIRLYTVAGEVARRAGQ